MSDSIVYYYPTRHQLHATPKHPERPERIEAIRDGLKAQGLWDRFEKLTEQHVDESVLFSIHTPEYLESLRAASQAGQWYDQDTYLTQDSFSVALQTAGGAIAIARSVWDNRMQTGFALCRPPGHHAIADQAMGFCLLNNVALAAEDLIRNRGVKRLAILDFDLHHGNGTQDIFWTRGDVFYFSTHQWPLYPYTGRLEDTGAGGGEGKTANLPFPPGTGDEGYLEGLERIFLPLLDRFRPEMLLISAGFDAHWMDPLGFLLLSAGGYAQIVSRLKGWSDKNCDGRIALFLEGGYDLQASAACAQACVSCLIDQDWRDTIGASPYRANNRWEKLIEQASLLWGLSP